VSADRLDESHMTTSTSGNLKLSVVVPVYNEAEGLQEFHRRVSVVLDSLSYGSEIVYVNDGSTDESLEVIKVLKMADPRVAIVDLSRNFGKEIAMTAGIDHSCGDAVVVIDADLQDPPELIPKLTEEWEQGFDVVYAQRVRRDGESSFKKLTAYTFYRVIQNVSRVAIPEDTGDFRLLSRRAVCALVQLREQHRFMKGLFAWIGFPQKKVLYSRHPRYAGKTKWNYWKLWNFALEGITSFTIAPLKIATYLGLLVAFASLVYAGVIVFKTLVYGNPVAGYPSLMVTILFLGGVQLIGIGIVGEYVGRMFNETKGRPLYFLKTHQPSTLGKGPRLEGQG
jgi:glycosyltransferase involved in cell wall biosynthesis